MYYMHTPPAHKNVMNARCMRFGNSVKKYEKKTQRMKNIVNLTLFRKAHVCVYYINDPTYFLQAQYACRTWYVCVSIRVVFIFPRHNGHVLKYNYCKSFVLSRLWDIPAEYSCIYVQLIHCDSIHALPCT